jgi:hypothetical protein
VTGFDRSDVIVTNGTVDALTSSDGGKTWKGVFTPAMATEAVAQISIAPSYTDLAGNVGLASKTPASISVDTISPSIASVSITDESGDGTVRAGEAAAVTFVFSEKVTGFDASDVTVKNGTLGPISSSDGG